MLSKRHKRFYPPLHPAHYVLPSHSIVSVFRPTVNRDKRRRNREFPKRSSDNRNARVLAEPRLSAHIVISHDTATSGPATAEASFHMGGAQLFTRRTTGAAQLDGRLSTLPFYVLPLLPLCPVLHETQSKTKKKKHDCQQEAKNIPKGLRVAGDCTGKNCVADRRATAAYAGVTIFFASASRSYCALAPALFRGQIAKLVEFGRSSREGPAAGVALATGEGS